MNESYFLSHSDRIYDITNKEAYQNNKNTYYNLIIKYSVKNPLHFLHYIFGSSVMVWDMTRDANWIGNPYYLKADSDIIAHDRDAYLNKINETPVMSYENGFFVNYGTAEYNMLNSIAVGFKQNIVTDTLFDSPATYMYLAIILLVIMHMITNSRDIYLIYLPNLLSILTIFASTPIQDTRYLYANLLVAYLLIIIILGMKQNTNETEYYISTKNPGIHKKTSPDNHVENTPNTNEKNFINIDNILEEKNISNKNPEDMESAIRAKILKELENQQKDKYN